MTKVDRSENWKSTAQINAAILGRWTALLLAVFAAAAFAAGITTLPRSGPYFCRPERTIKITR